MALAPLDRRMTHKLRLRHLELISAMRGLSSVPVIASGGAGAVGDFPPAIQSGADAVLAASVFHDGELTVSDVKRELAGAGLVVR